MTDQPTWFSHPKCVPLVLAKQGKTWKEWINSAMNRVSLCRTIFNPFWLYSETTKHLRPLLRIHFFHDDHLVGTFFFVITMAIPEELARKTKVSITLSRENEAENPTESTITRFKSPTFRLVQKPSVHSHHTK